MTRFAKFAWGLVGYTFLVVLWGAFVRASFSGDGCGAHWPDCHGELLPASPSAKTAIEFIHRASSGLVLPLVIILGVWATRLFAKGHPIRRAALGSIFFTCTEALIGMWLVKKELVARSMADERAIWMSLHLVNTFFLLMAMVVAAWYASGGQKVQWKNQGAVSWAVGAALAGMLVLGISGAVTALGDMLYPSATLIEGLRQDFSSTSHFLVRLRVLHPLIATSIGVYCIILVGLLNQWRPSPQGRRFGAWVVGVIFAQMGFGIANYFAGAPVWMQIVHLGLADLLWIALVMTSSAALAAPIPAQDVERVPVPDVSAPPVATWKAYLALTKPRVISLLLFTTLAAMFIAEGGWPGGWLLLAVAIGGYMAAGSANAINMVIDRDIDQRMKRTSKRPTVTQQISSGKALAFAATLAIGSCAILGYFANPLSALLAMAGLLFYVLVYSLLLKRRTWHNIVIGGAAGAFPPLVGFAAVTNHLTPFAWVLFAIIFMWTPVHFWALALLIKDDYKEAGVPMLPVVHGERATVIQIVVYAILTTLVSLIPVVQHEAGLPYLFCSIVLNGLLILRSFELYRAPERPRAVSLYKYSMLYLALLFVVIALDRGLRV